MEVGRLLEVPMPKFYTAEGRKALVLRKGFSSPTRDDVSTALGAWAIKTSKPFKLDNSKMKRSRTKQRDIWATCYDKNCEFCIHFQLGEGRDDSMLVDGSMAAVAIAPEWTIVDDVNGPFCDTSPMATQSSIVTGGTSTLYASGPCFPCKRMDL